METAARRTQRRWARVLIVVGLLVIAAVAIAAVAVALAGEEVSRRVDESTRESIVRYRLFDDRTVFVSTPSSATTDFVNAALLGLLALGGFGTWLRARGSGDGALADFSLVVGIGGLYLALDEALELNETYGYNLERLGRLQDLDLLVYGAPALLFAWIFRDILLSSKLALALGAAGFAAFGAAEVLDAAFGGLNRWEEYVEPLASLLFCASFAAYVLPRSAVGGQPVVARRAAR